MKLEHVECSACTAPVNMISADKCEYCGTALVSLPYLETISETLTRLMAERGEKVKSDILIVQNPSAVFRAEAFYDGVETGVEVINLEQIFAGAKTLVVLDINRNQIFREITPNPQKK